MTLACHATRNECNKPININELFSAFWFVLLRSQKNLHIILLQLFLCCFTYCCQRHCFLFFYAVEPRWNLLRGLNEDIALMFWGIWSSRFRYFWISIHVIDRRSKHGKQEFDKNSFIRYKLSWSWMMLQMSIFQEKENMFFDSYVHVWLWADNVCSLHFKNASLTV